MPFDASALSAVVRKFRARYGLSDSDARLVSPAFIVTDDGSTSTTSSTIAKVGSVIQLAVDGGMPDAITIGAADTVADIAADINALADGRTADVVAPDPTVLASGIPDFAARSILSTAVLIQTASDDAIESLLTESLSLVESVCRTRLLDDGATIEETTWEIGAGAIVLPDARIRRVEFVAVDTEQAMRIAYAGTGTGTVEVTEDRTLLLATRPDGSPTTVTTVELGDDVDLSDLANNVAVVTGWAATVLNDGPSLNLVPMPPERARNGAVTLYAWTPADAEYRLDREAGIVYLDDLTTSAVATNRAQGQARIRYRAGLASMPASLEGVILAIAKAGLDESRRTSGVQSESLGDYSYSLASTPVAAAAMQAAVETHRPALAEFMRRLP